LSIADLPKSGIELDLRDSQFIPWAPGMGDPRPFRLLEQNLNWNTVSVLLEQCICIDFYTNRICGKSLTVEA
jgi:hypothetical protein